MATITLYNHTRAKFLSGDFAVGDQYLVMLYSAFTFNAAATTKAAAEVGCTQLPTANGYTQDTKALAGGAVSIINTNEAMLDFDSPSWTASGAALAATHALVVNGTAVDDPPVAYIDFQGTITAPDGQPLTVDWDAAEGFITSKAPV